MTGAIIGTFLFFCCIAAGDAVYRLRKDQLRKFFKDLVWLGIIGGSVATSYNFLFRVEKLVITDHLNITFSPTIAFPLVVFVKVLICFWVYHMIFCIANSELISETGLKIFGVEMVNKKITKKTLDIDQTTESYETLAWQIDYADTLLTSFINYYITNFDFQVGMAARKPEAIRGFLRNILNFTYFQSYGEGECVIYVIPLTENGILQLDDPLRSMVELNDTGDDNRIGVFANVGIAYHRFEDEEFDTAIVIKTPEDYIIPRAEISAASMFFISMVKTVEYMRP